MSTQIAHSRRRFTTDEYHRMLEAGILYEGEPVELLAGEVFEAAAIGNRHSSCVARLNHLFTRALGDRVVVYVQSSIELAPDSEPEPDLALLAWRDDFYAGRLPRAEDVRLLVEVADSTYRHDLEVKLPIYARAGIEEVWIVRLEENSLEVYLESDGERYRSVRRLGPGESVTPLRLPELTLPVRQILP